MELLKSRTHWFLVLPASSEPEVRHIFDIAFGLKCLLSKSINYDSISIVIDNAPIPTINAVFSLFGLSLPERIHTSDDLESIIDTDFSENAVVFITGHGSPGGLDSSRELKPFPLYKMFQVTPNYKRVVFYFGQCFAGIFNNLPVSEHLGIKNSRCSIIAIGGTGLSSSVSLPVTVCFSANNEIRWSANIFLFHVFRWLISPVDVDGDNGLSVMDSFKYATINTNRDLEHVKKNENLSDYLSFLDILKQLKESPDSNLDGDKKLLRLSFEKMIGIRFVIQEPWILNTRVAMKTNF